MFSCESYVMVSRNMPVILFGYCWNFRFIFWRAENAVLNWVSKSVHHESWSIASNVYVNRAALRGMIAHIYRDEFRLFGALVDVAVIVVVVFIFFHYRACELI